MTLSVLLKMLQVYVIPAIEPDTADVLVKVKSCVQPLTEVVAKATEGEGEMEIVLATEAVQL